MGGKLAHTAGDRDGTQTQTVRLPRLWAEPPQSAVC